MRFNKFVFALFLTMTSVTPLTTTGCDRGVAKYDTLVDKDEACTMKWADYEAQLQRRADLIPSIVNTVKGSAAHEEKVLKEVTEARASATQIKLSAEDFTDPEKMKKFNEAQDKIKGSLSRLMMVQETYPDLKANNQFHDLMVSLEGTENRILIARRDYNDAVMKYNTELRHVSGKVINPLTGHEFKPRVYYQADEASKSAPKVDFSSSSSSSVK